MKIRKQDGPPEDLIYFDEDLNLTQNNVEDVVDNEVVMIDVKIVISVHHLQSVYFIYMSLKIAHPFDSY